MKQDSISVNSTLTPPKTIIEIPTKNYVNKKFDDPKIIKNTDPVDFNNKNLDNVHSIKINSFPTFEEQLTPKVYVDNAIFDGVNEQSQLRLDPEEKLNLDEQDSIILNSI